MLKSSIELKGTTESGYNSLGVCHHECPHVHRPTTKLTNALTKNLIENKRFC